MKKVIVALLVIVFSISLYAQKKKNVQTHKIKSTTVYNADFEDNDGKQVKESYMRFDDSGNTVEEVEYDKKGAEKKHILYEYDADGNKIRETYFKTNGSKEKIIEFKYQDSLRIERTVYFGNGKIKSKKKYIYEFQK
jgi:uncharacterized protein YxeA